MDDVLLGRTVDSPLDAHGVAQAHALGLRLADSCQCIKLEASPRRRTLQTAQAIAQHVKCEAVAAPAFDEVDFGIWSGQPFAALALDSGWRFWNVQRSRCRTPAGETIACIQERVTRRLMQLSADSPHGTIGIVTHAEIIRSMLLHWLEIPVDEFHRVTVPPASVTTVDLSSADVSVIGMPS